MAKTPINRVTPPAADPQSNATSEGKCASPDGPNTHNTVTETNEKTSMLSTESGGRGGPDPTRYGDWEKAGRCIDF